MTIKTVLFIVQNNSYPFDKRVKKEACSLRDAGYHVLVISPVTPFDSAVFEIVDGVEVYRFNLVASDGTKAGFFKEFAVSLTKIYALFMKLCIIKRFDVVHVSNPPDFFWPLAIVSKLIGVKFVYDQHDLAPEMFRTKYGDGVLSKFLRWSEKMTVILSDRIVVVNQTFLERSVRLWGRSESVYSVVYNGPAGDFRPIANPDLMEKYRGRHVLLYVGLMTVNDNVEILLDVAHDLVHKRGRTDFYLILVGGGDVEDVLQLRVKELDLSNYVELTGIVQHRQVMEYLGVAEVCLAPDAPNGLNEYLTLIKILEYMKAGKPFVSFQLPETMSMAQDGGLYAKDSAEFGDLVQSLVDDPGKAKAIGEIGRRIVEDRYLWSRSEEVLLRLYESLE